MKTFDYTIKDALGIHARPAGLLVKAVKASGSSVSITKGEQTVAADRLLSVMGMGIRCGDTVTVTVSGGDEEAAAKLLQEFFEKHL